METITNAATAASKVIFGDNAAAESGQEPIAGESGRGTADSPYDHGNLEGESGSAGPDAGNSGPTGTAPTSGANTSTDTQSGIPSSGSQTQGSNISGQIRPEHDQDKTGVTGIHSDDAKFSDQHPSDSNATSTSDRGQKAPAGGVGAVEPSVGAAPSSGQQPTQKQQGADRPDEEPSSDVKSSSEKDKQALFEKATGKKEDHSGEPLGKYTGTKPESSGGAQEEKPGSSKSSGEGSGEQYVKSTGLAAEGGDFDATRPGAGKEADRLLEEHGVHHEPGAHKSEGDTGAHDTGNGNGKKHGVGEKIKQKLHIGKH